MTDSAVTLHKQTSATHQLPLSILSPKGKFDVATPRGNALKGHVVRILVVHGCAGAEDDAEEHRRQQVEAVRAQLQARVDAAVQKRRSLQLPDQAPALEQAGTGGPAAQANGAPQGTDALRKEAEDRVCA